MKYSLSYIIAIISIGLFIKLKYFPGQEMYGWNDVSAVIVLAGGLGISFVLFILVWIISKFIK